MVAAHASAIENTASLIMGGRRGIAAVSECCRHSGVDEAEAALAAVYEDMEHLMKAINAAPVNSIEGLRAKRNSAHDPVVSRITRRHDFWSADFIVHFSRVGWFK